MTAAGFKVGWALSNAQTASGIQVQPKHRSTGARPAAAPTLSHEADRGELEVTRVVLAARSEGVTAVDGAAQFKIRLVAYQWALAP
eukprot:CAMPEP_0202851176 /NCGR_PEP_ID=MMETSP1389-20130828/85584_1 /ASSEMBLY_ACC=CAM_ASM_000865 /TAXON_ID=302021 /ORGANISM="Rhodomonas sp., Strain CCMP768" /LENGTH=85 /DNA_ID=CAMNT_0049529451 /DNA_START=10 /DNA_END=265 /DNA_ORIENTATION=+